MKAETREERQGDLATLYNGTIIQEKSEVYHGKSGGKSGKNLSSHLLTAFLKSARMYQKMISGEIEREDSKAFQDGRAAHCIVGEGWEEFNEQFTCKSPINEKTGKPYGPLTKVFQEWVESQDKEVLTEGQWKLALKLGEAVARHPFVAQNKLFDRTNGVAEGVVRATMEGLPCQIRMDFLNYKLPFLVEFKTCGNLTYFEQDAKRFRYPNQMAFYRSVFEAATGDRLPVILVGVEKVEPYRVGAWSSKLPGGEETLNLAEEENVRAMNQIKGFASSLGGDPWPTGYEELRSLSF